MKKGTNQIEIDLSPSVANIELHSNQMWRDLSKFYSLVEVLENFLKLSR